MFEWFRTFYARWSGRHEAPAVPCVPSRPMPPDYGAQPTSENSNSGKATDTPAEASDDFAPYIRALGLQIPAPVAISPEEDERDGEIAKLVLEHFYKNRPGPTSFPTLSLRILNIVADPNAQIGELAKLIGRDPAMSAAVLKVANSAAFHGMSEVETVRDSITRLGLQEVARVAGMVSARSLFNPRVRAEFTAFGQRWNALFHQSATTATSAAWLSMQCPGGRSDRAFLGGMLHDVGKSIALRSIAALLIDHQLALDASDSRIDRVLDRVHVEIGGEVHQEWSLPNFVTMLCVRHHDEDIPTDAEFVDIHAVRLASALHLIRVAPELNPRAEREVRLSVKALGMNAFQLRSLDTEIRRTADQMLKVLGLESSRPLLSK